ncbi:PaaI family thioesterase [Chloroflexota bacterium]
MMENKPDYVAELLAKGKDEPVAAFLGMRLVELKPGYARVSMLLKPEHMNFNGLVFGGIIMSLADHAFSYGSNSLSHPSVASQFNVHFINGAAVDDELMAECRVVRSGRRVGISEITVVNQDGKLVARATGTTIPVGGNQAD